ncbi:MAG: P-loop NTPase [Propionibacteriaceae bacterium]
MTLRQVLAVIWQRKILVAITLVLVMLVAYGYLQSQTKVYTSTITLRFNAALTKSATDSSGAYANFFPDVDTDLIQTRVIAEPAARDLNMPDPQVIQAAASGTLSEGTSNSRVVITATGPTAAQAQRRAQAVAKSYMSYVNDQISKATATLKMTYRDAQQAQTRALKRVNANPNDITATTQLSEAGIRASAASSQLQLIAIAGPPVSVLKPAAFGLLTSASRLTVLGVGFLSGLIAGIGAALIRDQFDDRLLSAEDAEAAIGEPVLGELAVDKGRKKNDMSVPTERRTNTAFNEGIRTLRTSLQVLAPQRHSMVVVTSPEPGEGKTFVTASLAVSLARAGRQVIIVSGDLRRPRLTRYFGVPDSPGLADAIVGEVDKETLRGMLQPASQQGLMVLPHGSRDVDPADLLATPAVGPVLARLRQLADIVIIDSPPALALADAANLATHADGVLVISALHRTKRLTLTGTLRNLRANGVNVFGVVCNRSTDAVPKSYEATYLLDQSNALPENDDDLLDLDADQKADTAPSDSPNADSPNADSKTPIPTSDAPSNGAANGKVSGHAASNGHSNGHGADELTTVVRRTGRRQVEES